MMFKFTINPKNANQLPSTNLLQEQKFSGRYSLSQLLWFLWAHSCIPQLAIWMSTWSISHYVSLPKSSYVPGCVAASLLVGLDCLLLRVFPALMSLGGNRQYAGVGGEGHWQGLAKESAGEEGQEAASRKKGCQKRCPLLGMAKRPQQIQMPPFPQPQSPSKSQLSVSLIVHIYRWCTSVFRVTLGIR